MLSLLESYRRTLAGVIGVLLLVNSLVTLRAVIEPTAEAGTPVAAPGDGSFVDPTVPGGVPTTVAPGGTPTAKGTKGRVVPGGRTPISGYKPGTYVKGLGTIPLGVTDKEIRLTYYWKGDQTKNSQYLSGTGQQGSVDEGEAFRKLIAWVNRHPNGDATLMGFRFNLHGRRLVGGPIDAGKYPDDFSRTSEKIIKTIKPFAAISSHGGLSSYICPRLAAAKIMNLSTYDLSPGLRDRTNGYCLPADMSFEQQVDVVTSFLSNQAKATTYQGSAGDQPSCAASCKRVYGFLYAEYPELVKSAGAVVKRLEKAGVNIAKVQSIAWNLTDGQQQAADIAAKFADAKVNTIISPDAAAILNFTHGSQASGYQPDYFVWPCSGQDNLGMVRLYNQAQWARASGLSCYDEEINADLTNDDRARDSEWYKAYKEVAPNDEPPAPTSLVYKSLLPLLVGITHAGPTLTVERFREGLDRFKPYRYNAITGKTTNDRNILLTLNAADGSQIGDVATVYWSPTRRLPGSATPGSYVYSDRRYDRHASFK